MAKMKYWDGQAWVILDAKDADTLDGKHASEFADKVELDNHLNNHPQGFSGNYDDLTNKPTIVKNLVDGSANGSARTTNASSVLGENAFACGNSTASGWGSHAQNENTVAQGKSQTVIGRYNTGQGTMESYIDTDHAFIVGNGTSDSARSNALSLTWDGTLDVAKNVKVAGKSVLTYKTTGTSSGAIPTNADLFKGKPIEDFSLANRMLNGTGEFSVRTSGAIDTVENPLGQYAFACGKDTIATGNSGFACGQGASATGWLSHATGYFCVASEGVASAEGESTTASGYGSHSEGINTQAKGTASHAEGSASQATGNYSHAEGSSTVASGISAHAEGSSCTASGKYSHAEGRTTTAVGDYSHAEGGYTSANGEYAHTRGRSTIANGYAQTAIGKYNLGQGEGLVANPTDHVFIIGNGESSSARSNALTVTWEGTLDVAKGYTVGGVPVVLKTEFDALQAEIQTMKTQLAALQV